MSVLQTQNPKPPSNTISSSSGRQRRACAGPPRRPRLRSDHVWSSNGAGGSWGALLHSRGCSLANQSASPANRMADSAARRANSGCGPRISSPGVRNPWRANAPRDRFADLSQGARLEGRPPFPIALLGQARLSRDAPPRLAFNVSRRHSVGPCGSGSPFSSRPVTRGQGPRFRDSRHWSYLQRRKADQAAGTREISPPIHPSSLAPPSQFGAVKGPHHFSGLGSAVTVVESRRACAPCAPMIAECGRRGATCLTPPRSEVLPWERNAGRRARAELGQKRNFAIPTLRATPTWTRRRSCFAAVPRTESRRN